MPTAAVPIFAGSVVSNANMVASVLTAVVAVPALFVVPKVNAGVPGVAAPPCT